MRNSGVFHKIQNKIIKIKAASPIGLVQHQPAEGAEGDAQRVLDVVHQAARRGHQDVDAFTQPERETV